VPETQGAFVLHGSDIPGMTETFELGNEPKKATLYLNAGADHTSTIQREGIEPWDPATDIYLEIEFADKSEAVATAVIDGTNAIITIDQDDVDAYIARRPRKVRVWYHLGETRLLWGLGEVRVTK
jgi:hypothetical protein